MTTTEDLLKEAKRQILDLQVTVDALDALLAPKATSAPVSVGPKRKRRYFPEWTSLKASPRGVFRPGMAGHVKSDSGKVSVMLTTDLNFKVIQPGHPLEGQVFDSPSTLCMAVQARRAVNGFKHVVLDGHSLSELRDYWMSRGLTSAT